jgi:hypothetical protein
VKKRATSPIAAERGRKKIVIRENKYFITLFENSTCLMEKAKNTNYNTNHIM